MKGAGRALVWLEPRDGGRDVSYGAEGSEGAKLCRKSLHEVFDLHSKRRWTLERS